MAHKNFESLKKAVLNKAKKVMTNDMMPIIEDLMQSAIEETVYDVYEPVSYKRRGFSNGGLGDRENIEGFVSKDTKDGFIFNVRNIAMPSRYDEPQVYLTPLIVLGQEGAMTYGYDLLYYEGSENKPYGKPRDFLRATVDKMYSSDFMYYFEYYMKR
jgi:hypothetical protein